MEAENTHRIEAIANVNRIAALQAEEEQKQRASKVRPVEATDAPRKQETRRQDNRSTVSARQVLQDIHSQFNAQVTFTRDKASGNTIIRVIDKESGEVLRQIPPEEILTVALCIDRYLGNQIDKKF